MRTRFEGKHFQPLYKKHRPKSFDEFMGNKSTINKLKAIQIPTEPKTDLFDVEMAWLLMPASIWTVTE